MKSILATTGIFALAALFTSAISIGEMPQDPPRGKKHIQLMKIDDKGNKTELDTVLKAGQIFVWNGDTIGDGKEMKWISKEGSFSFDSDMDFESDSLHKIFVTRADNFSAPKVFAFSSDGDSAQQFKVRVFADGDDQHIMKWNTEDGDNMIFTPSPAHKMIMMHDRKKGNVIDLSDPGIISFEKKELKDGKEKITIIREKPSDEEMELNEEIMIQGVPAAPMMFGAPHKAKTIKVISGDDGKVEIIEDGKLMHVDEMNEDVKVIEKDGKKIVIRKKKEGDEVKVNVEVEEQKEKK